MKISYSKLRKITTCLYQYKLHYIDGWRRKRSKAIFAFGDVSHKTVTAFLNSGQCMDTKNFFTSMWNSFKDKPLDYSKNDSFDGFMDIGLRLAEQIPDSLKGITNIHSIEGQFNASLPVRNTQTGLKSIQLFGYIDFIGSYRHKEFIFEIKSLKSYPRYEADMNDQLTFYSMVKRLPDVGMIALIKTKKDPHIEIHTATRSQETIRELQWKIFDAADNIKKGRFPKVNNMMTCNMCDFLPLCYGTQADVEENLIRTNVSQKKTTIKSNKQQRRTSTSYPEKQLA